MDSVVGRKSTTFRDANGKVCTKCNEYREYKFYAIRNDAKDGYKSHCKCCINKSKEQLQQEKEAKIEAIKTRTEKSCSDCHTVKHITEFHINRQSLDGLYCRCKDCEKEFRKEQREKHSDKRIGSKRLYYKNRVIATKCFDRTKMNEFYEEARRLTIENNEQYVVDHKIPIFSNDDMLVCGLHNEFNLQVITSGDNVRKGNKFDSDDGFYPEFLDS
jgi:hypothetical protein